MNGDSLAIASPQEVVPGADQPTAIPDPGRPLPENHEYFGFYRQNNAHRRMTTRKKVVKKRLEGLRVKFLDKEVGPCMSVRFVSCRSPRPEGWGFIDV